MWVIPLPSWFFVKCCSALTCYGDSFSALSGEHIISGYPAPQTKIDDACQWHKKYEKFLVLPKIAFGTVNTPKKNELEYYSDVPEVSSMKNPSPQGRQW